MGTEPVTRRALLRRAALGLGVLACGRVPGQALGQPAADAAYVAIETAAATGVSLARFLGPDGATTGTVPLDFRAHGMARHGDLMAVFPRRPGTRFALIDAATLEIRAVVDAPADRHFYGHGAFAVDGRTLLVTENDLHTLGGALGIYEIGAHARRVGTIALPGPGPHDIQREGTTDRFHVALGGLTTHPDYGRTPLNLPDFTSEIVAVDLARGGTDPMGRWTDADGVSLRHLADDGRGRLVVGGQRRRPARAEGRMKRRGVLWLVENGAVRPIDVGDRLGGYVSSVAARDGRALVTSKRTGRAFLLEGDSVVREWRIEGASAAALGRGGPIASGYVTLRLGGARTTVLPGHEFDNHGIAVA